MNKKIGGTARAKVARTELSEILNNPSHPDYTKKDIYFAKRYDVSRHTIYKIRDDLKCVSRPNRLINFIKKNSSDTMTIQDIATKTGIRYQLVYKAVKDNKIPYLPLKSSN